MWKYYLRHLLAMLVALLLMISTAYMEETSETDFSAGQLQEPEAAENPVEQTEMHDSTLVKDIVSAQEKGIVGTENDTEVESNAIAPDRIEPNDAAESDEEVLVVADSAEDTITEITVDLSEIEDTYDDFSVEGMLYGAEETLLVINDVFEDGVLQSFISENYDKYTGTGVSISGADGKLSSDEINAISFLSISNKGITSLKGIESLTSLQFLECSNNQMGSLDVSGLSQLTYLDCSRCGLTSLKLNGCSNLRSLYFHGNALRAVDISDCTAIPPICTAENRKVHYMDNNADKNAYMGYTSAEEGISVFFDYGVAVNPLTNTEPALIPIDKEHFPDQAFRDYVAANLDTYNAIGASGQDGALSEKDIMDVWQLQLYNYDPATKTSSGFGISSLKGIQYFTALKYFGCAYNTLTGLDVSGMANLIELDCSYNRLQSLNVSGCTNLKHLDCHANSLTTLDISDCEKLLPICIPKCVEEWQDNDGSFHTGYNGYRDGNKDLTVEYDYGVTIITEKNAGGNEQPSGGNEQPSGGNEQPSGGNEQPSGGNEQPSGGNEQPAHGNGNSDLTGSTPISPVPVVVQEPIVISCTRSASKTTVVAAPGDTCKLDLGGATGKGFKSSKKKVATVDGNGTVTVKGAGKTKITFKVGKKKRTVTLTVKDLTVPTSVSFAPVASSSVKKGDSVTLTPVIPDGTNAGGFKWKSSNKKVAKVSSDGTVTFKKKGKVMITATAKRGKKKAKIKFTVSN